MVDPYFYRVTLMLNHFDNSRPISIHSHIPLVNRRELSARDLVAPGVADGRMESRMMKGQRWMLHTSRRRHIDMDSHGAVAVVGDYSYNQKTRMDVSLLAMMRRWMLDLDRYRGDRYDLEVDHTRTLYM